MKLLGEWNWYLPSWLEWLPRVSQEPSVAAAPAVPAPRLRIDVRPGAYEVRLVLSGELDLATVAQLREQLREAEVDTDIIVIDLRGVSFVDSSGLGELVAANQRARRRQARLVVVRGEGTRMAKVLATTGLDSVLTGEEGR